MLEREREMWGRGWGAWERHERGFVGKTLASDHVGRLELSKVRNSKSLFEMIWTGKMIIHSVLFPFLESLITNT